MRNRTRLSFMLAAAIALAPFAAKTQTYPTQAPTYVPSPLLGAQPRHTSPALWTGSPTVPSAGGLGGARSADVSQLTRPSYWAGSPAIGTGATTHFFQVIGSAPAPVRVTRISCSGVATAAVTP